MDSDNSDDDLFKTPAFKKRTRREVRKEAAKDDFLEDCMTSAERMMQDDIDMNEAAMEDDGLEDDNLMEKVVKIKEENMKMKTHEDTRDALENFDAIDPDGLMDRDRRRALVEALDAQRTPCLGLRSTITSFRPMKTMTIFSSKEAAAQNLNALLESLETSAAKSVKTLVSYLQVVCDSDQLEDLLLEKSLLCRFLIKHGMKLPHELYGWLDSVAQSGGMGRFDLAVLGVGASKTLNEMTDKNLLEQKYENHEVEKLLSQLTCWVNHAADSKLSPKGDEQTDTSRNLLGLEHVLRTIAGSISSIDSSLSLSDEAATSAVCLISRIGLDPLTVSNTSTSDLGELLCLALRAVIDNMAQTSNFESWSQHTATEVFKQDRFTGLGKGLETAEDYNDSNGWYCRARTLSLFDVSSSHPLSLQFKAVAAFRALESCLLVNLDDCVAKFSEQLNNAKLRDAVSTSLIWKTLFAPRAALEEASSQGDDVELNPPRINALCDCVFQTFIVGCDLLLMKQQKLSGSYYSEEDARMLLYLLNLSANRQNRLQSRLASMANNSFFRRANYCLSTLETFIASYLRPIVENSAGYDDGETPKATKQSSVASFFSVSAKAS